jgi:hypothetical protein
MLARMEHREGVGELTFVYVSILIFSHIFAEGFEDTLLGDLEVLAIVLREGDVSVDNISK